MRLTHILSLLAVFALGSAALAGDIIMKKDGKAIGNTAVQAGSTPTEEQFGASNIRVVDETIETVQYRIEGIPTVQRVDTADVAEVYLDPSNTPPALRAGASNLDAAAYDQAIAQFDQVLGSRADDLYKARAAWGKARALFAVGDWGGAADAIGTLRNDHAKSRFVPNATKLRARALLNQGKVKEAAADFESIKTISGVSEADKLEADYWSTWIAHQVATNANDQAGLKKARTQYDALKTRLGTTADPALQRIRDLCVVGAAACDIALGDAPKAESPLEKVIKKSEDDLVLAGAYTQLGNVHLHKAGSGGDAKTRKDALYHFLRVVCLYGQADGAENYLAESLYQAGVLFNELKPDAATDKDGNLEARRRARREWRECIQRFPGSSWARLAQSAMQSR